MIWRRRTVEEAEQRSEEVIAQGVALRYRLLEASEHLAAFVADVREEIENRRRPPGGGEKKR